MSPAVLLCLQDTYRLKLQCIELHASMSKEGEDKGHWTLLGEVSQDGRADVKARSFRKGQGVLPHPSPVSTPSSGTSSGTCLSSQKTSRKLSFFSLCWFSPLLVTFSSLWGQTKPTLAQGKWQEHVAGAKKWRWDLSCQQQQVVKLNSGGWCWGTLATEVAGEGVEGGQLTARGSLGVEGQELRAGESQGAESLVQGKETARCDWIQSWTNVRGQTETGRGGGEGVKCRKGEGLRVGRSLEGSNTECKLGLGKGE